MCILIGNILLGILITWVLGIVCELCGIYVPDAAAGYASLLPDFSNGLAVPSIAPTAWRGRPPGRGSSGRAICGATRPIIRVTTAMPAHL